MQDFDDLEKDYNNSKIDAEIQGEQCNNDINYLKKVNEIVWYFADNGILKKGKILKIQDDFYHIKEQQTKEIEKIKEGKVFKNNPPLLRY